MIPSYKFTDTGTCVKVNRFFSFLLHVSVPSPINYNIVLFIRNKVQQLRERICNFTEWFSPWRVWGVAAARPSRCRSALGPARRRTLAAHALRLHHRLRLVRTSHYLIILLIQSCEPSTAQICSESCKFDPIHRTILRPSRYRNSYFLVIMLFVSILCLLSPPQYRTHSQKIKIMWLKFNWVEDCIIFLRLIYTTVLC